MRPFQVPCWHEGFDAMLMGKPRSENPYKRHDSAWDRYREDAWDSGWFRAERGDAPLPKPEPTKRQLAREIKKLLAVQP